MTYKYSKRSLDNLVGVKQPLVDLFMEAITNSPYDFVITCGLRTVEQQKVLVATGKSTTMRSKHLTGNAVDFACFDENGKITWEAKYYKAVATHIKKLATKLGVKIVWGGDWKSFVDMPHIQLDV